MNNRHSLRANRQLKRATERGANLTEFSAAIVVLVIGFMVPLLDLGVIPIHWLLSKEIISSYVRKLALSETFSQAMTQVNSDPALQNWLTQLGGVKPESIQCKLIISKLTPPLDVFTTDQPRSIPAGWLPGGPNSPCSYEIDLAVTAQFDPLIILPVSIGKIPGLTEPYTCVVEAKAPWENFGCNPISKQFFINE
jgi:hypothetical protein